MMYALVKVELIGLLILKCAMINLHQLKQCNNVGKGFPHLRPRLSGRRPGSGRAVPRTAPAPPAGGAGGAGVLRTGGGQERERESR